MRCWVVINFPTKFRRKFQFTDLSLQHKAELIHQIATIEQITEGVIWMVTRDISSLVPHPSNSNIFMLKVMQLRYLFTLDSDTLTLEAIGFEEE